MYLQAKWRQVREIVTVVLPLLFAGSEDVTRKARYASPLAC